MKALVCVVFFALSATGASSCGNNKAATLEPAPQEKPVEGASTPTPAVEEPSVQVDAATLEFSGTLQPARVSMLSSKSTGLLKSIYSREGTRVVAGQVLCALDATDIELRVEAARLAYLQADENFKNAQNEHKRNKELFEAKALTGSVWEKVELGLKMAELGQKQAAVGVRMAEQALADTRIKAPFSGIVTKLLAEEGQYITSMPPTMILVIADVDHLKLKVAIPERNLTQVKVGTPVEISVPAARGNLSATVERVTEVVDPATRSAEAIVTIDNRERKWPAGTYARVKFPTLVASPNQEDDFAPSAKL